MTCPGSAPGLEPGSRTPGSGSDGTRFDVVCLGLATLDTIVLTPFAADSDARVEVDELVHAGGGPAATAAVTLARLGASVAFSGCVGADDAGASILAELGREGVDTSAVVAIEALSTSESVVVVERDRAARTIYTTGSCRRLDARALEVIASRAAPLVARATWVHVDHLGYSIWAAAPRSEALLSVDDGNPIAGLDLSEVELYAPTERAIEARYPRHGLEASIDLAHRDGAGSVVVTAGSRGCVVSNGNGPRRVRGVEVPVVSTLGAGDVFHGTLLWALLGGAPLIDAAETACQVAGRSCAGLDARSAIPRRVELERTRRDRSRTTPDPAPTMKRRIP